MNHFSSRIKYKVGRHAVERWYQRSPTEHRNPELNAIGNILQCVNHAQVLFEYKRLRVLRYRDLVFPCIRLGVENDYDYKVATVMTWEMVKVKPQMLNGIYRPEVKRARNKSNNQKMKMKKKLRKAAQQ